MNQRLKRWESPRSEGRNTKGKGGSARQRQKKKQLQMLRNKLKSGINHNQNTNTNKKENAASGVLFFIGFEKITCKLPQKLVGLSHQHPQLHGNPFPRILLSQTCNA